MLNRAVYKQTLIMLVLAVGGACILSCMPSQPGSSDYDAWIAIESDNAGIKVKAYCRNNTSVDTVVSYELKAKKTGQAGRTQSSQKGSVEVASRDKSCLSQLSLSFSADDRYRIELKVYKDEQLVAEDFVSYPKEL